MTTEQKAITQKKENSYVGFVALFSWIFHQESWTNNKLFPTLVIRYEDLQNETFLTFKKVIDFIESKSIQKILLTEIKQKRVFKVVILKNLKN